MTRQKLSQRPRHVSPTRPRSRTMWSTPAAASSWLSESPACPAPTTMTSTAGFIDAHCKARFELRSAGAHLEVAPLATEGSTLAAPRQPGPRHRSRRSLTADARLDPANVPCAPAGQHAGGLTHLGDQHDLP